MIEIAPVRPEETELLYQLIRELAVYEKLEHEVSATPHDIHQLLFGPRPYADALIARYGGQPAGFAVFFHNVSTFAGRAGLYLEDLYVRPELRKQGIGLALLRAVARIAHERGCRRLEWTALEWNKLALDFYARVGANVRPDWRVLRLEGNALEQLAMKK